MSPNFFESVKSRWLMPLPFLRSVAKYVADELESRLTLDRS
jgi:hypothetical protein